MASTALVLEKQIKEKELGEKRRGPTNLGNLVSSVRLLDGPAESYF